MFNRDKNLEKCDKKVIELEDRIHNMEEYIKELEEAYMEKTNKYDELKRQLKTLKTILYRSEFPEIRIIKIDDRHFEAVRYCKEIKGFYTPEFLVLEKGDYFILQNASNTDTVFVRLIRLVEKHTVDEIPYDMCEKLGFAHKSLLENDLYATYPKIDKKTGIYFYWVEIIS